MREYNEKKIKADSERVCQKRWKQGWSFDTFIESLNREELLLWMRNFVYQMKYKHGKKFNVPDEEMAQMEADLEALELEVEALQKNRERVAEQIKEAEKKSSAQQIEDFLRAQGKQRPLKNNN